MIGFFAKIGGFLIVINIFGFIALPTIVCSQVKADFVFDKSEGCGSLAVSFTDQSTTSSGTINDWYWDMGGVISVRQNPGSIFTKSGEFTICLTVKTTTGLSAKICKEKIIKVYENPVADFEVNTSLGCVPVNAEFKDKSTTKNGEIKSWIWDIGGSANILSATSVNSPVITTYSAPAKYSATLSITDSKGCKNTITKRNQIDVVGLTPPSLDYSLNKSCDLPWDIQFKNLKVDSLTKYTWDFGNGTTFEGFHPPVARYTQPGSFTVSLMMQKGPCRDTIRFPGIVNTNRITDFEVSKQGLCIDQSIKFKDISNYVSDSLIWDFGDGTTSKASNPEKIYTNEGCYSIKLKKYIGGCAQEITKPCIDIAAKPKINTVISNGLSCLLPATVKFNASADISGKFTWKITGGPNEVMLEGDTASYLIKDYGSFNAAYQFVGVNGCIITSDAQKLEVKPFEISLPSLGPEGCIPYAASINNGVTSNAPIVSWKWEVGNPVIFSSSDANPVFQVSQEGRYDLKLVATNDFGCKDSIINTNYIRGGRPPSVDFTATPIRGCISDSRKFTALTGTNADFWTWTLSDNDFFSNEKNPEYTFSDFGVFDITLTASHNGCKNFLRKNQYIVVYEPKSSFEVKYSCDQPNTIGIQNQSVGADIYYWEVKISDTKKEIIRDSLLSSYTFPGRGLYFLTHYSKSIETGCEHIKTDSIFIVDLKASYTLDTIRGCAPLSVKINTLIQDAVLTKFQEGRYEIFSVNGNETTAIFRESGSIEGPKMIVTDRHGCVDSFQVSTPVEVGKITAQIESQNVFCSPDFAKFNNISISSQVPVVEKKWYFSHKDQEATTDSITFNIADPGLYYISLKVRDQWGCTDSVTKEIKAVELIPAFSGDTLSCSKKAVQFKIDSDPAFLEKFTWTFGDGTSASDKNPLHYYVNEGKYNVCAELFDSRGCSKKLCKPSFLEIKNPKADFSGTPNFAPCPPLLSEFKNQSKNAVSYTWDFGDNSGLSYNENPGRLYTSPGDFDVTLLAELIPGCVDTLKKAKYINLNGPVANMNIDIVGNCTPLDIQLSATSDKPYDYIWDFGDGKIQSVTGLVEHDTTDYKYDNPGTFIPKLLVSDDKGCTRTFTLEPIEVSHIKPNFTGSSVPLCGLPVSLKLENKTTSTSSALSYFWKATGAKEYVNHDVKPEFLVDAYGKYNISLIAKAPNCIDSLTRDSIVEVAAIPGLDFSFTDKTVCQNVKLNVENNSTIDYGNVISWYWSASNGMTSNDKIPSMYSDKPGSFSVKLTAMSDKGCKDSISKTVTLLPSALITLPSDKTICIGDSIDITSSVTGQGVVSKKWVANKDIKCDTCPFIIVRPMTTTQYFLTSQSENGCINTDSIKVTVINIPGPALSISKDTIVCQNGTASIHILNYNPDYTYTWDKNAKGLDCYEDCKVVNVSPQKETYYKVLAKNIYGCFKEDSVKVGIETSIPDFLIDQKTICEDNKVTLKVSHGNHPQWKQDPDLQCTLCPETTAKPERNKYYYVTVMSDNKCLYTDSVFVKLLSGSDISAGEDRTVCKDEVITLNGRGTGRTLWISDSKIADTTALTTTSKAEKSAYYILQTINDECKMTDTLLVNVILKNDIQSIGDTICPGDLAMISVKGNSDQYIWTENGKEMGKGNKLELKADTTTKVLVIGSRTTCIPDTAETVVVVHPKIQYQIKKKEYNLYLNTKQQIDITLNPLKKYTYIWNPSSGLSCEDCPQPYLKSIEQPTEYEVIVKDEYGCQLKQKILVNVKDQCVKDGFYIPNIFTPYNRDGKNDEFRVYAEDKAEFISIVVFDRWGEKIWATQDINETWDGYYNGKELVRGVYTYIVIARCEKTNNNINFVGDVTIID